MHHNFCRSHQTLRVTPAMEAGLTDHPWEIAELVALLNAEVVVAAWAWDRSAMRYVIAAAAVVSGGWAGLLLQRNMSRLVGPVTYDDVFCPMTFPPIRGWELVEFLSVALGPFLAVACLAVIIRRRSGRGLVNLVNAAPSN